MQRCGWCGKYVPNRVPALAGEGPVSIDHVLLMIDGEYPSPVNLHFNGRLVAVRKPKTINSLVLADEGCWIDPERWFFGRGAGDSHNRKVLSIDPYFPLEQILFFAFRSGFENEATIRANLLLACQHECVIRGRDGTVVVFPAGRCLALALDQAVEHQVTHDPRTLFGGLVERFLVGSLVVDTYQCLSRQFPLKISDHVRPHGRISLQLLVSQTVALKHFCDDVVACQTQRSNVARWDGSFGCSGGEVLALCHQRHRSRSQDKSDDDQFLPPSSLNCHSLLPPLVSLFPSRIRTKLSVCETENEAIHAALKASELAKKRRTHVVVHIMEIAVVREIDGIQADANFVFAPALQKRQVQMKISINLRIDGKESREALAVRHSC